MSESAELLLAVIAVAVAVMAIVQVGAMVAALRVARRVEQLAGDLQSQVTPLVAHLTTLSADAARAAHVAATQVERLDTVLAELTGRLEDTLAAAQRVVAGPTREGMAIVAGVRAAIAAIRSLRESARRRAVERPHVLESEEESLFIG